MKLRRNRYNHGFGKADPFGLLVVAVLLAVSLTIAVQAQVSRGQDQDLFDPAVVPLITLD